MQHTRGKANHCEFFFHNVSEKFCAPVCNSFSMQPITRALLTNSLSPRGYALIIDNEEFENLPARRGSHVDSDCLSRLYQQARHRVELSTNNLCILYHSINLRMQLGFFVLIKRNLRRVSFKYELVSFATDNIHHQMDMAIVTVLSHGENGSIICTNGEKIEIEEILGMFNNREAPPLKGKPKFFIFQGKIQKYLQLFSTLSKIRMDSAMIFPN